MNEENDMADARAVLADYRASIDNIDAALIHMLAERFRCTKAVGVLKKRLGDFARTLREIAITCDGVQVGEPLVGLRGVLTGTPEWTPPRGE